jgi:lipopolysaccharide export system permease protein
MVTLVGESISTKINREINPTPPGLGGGIARTTGDIWLQQNNADGSYFMRAESARENGSVLHDVLVFPTQEDSIRRIWAEQADFIGRKWQFHNVILTGANGRLTREETYEMLTRSTRADLRVTLGSTEDFTYFELLEVLTSGVSDPAVQAEATTRLSKLASLPLLLVGSLLIAFAFTAGYRRGNAFGMSIIYGIMLGFIVFVITEMADRAGSSGVLNPLLATWGPAFVSVIIGLSVLLQKEDGRA